MIRSLLRMFKRVEPATKTDCNRLSQALKELEDAQRSLLESLSKRG